jgi:ribonucleoside-diphosphate reductase alpha chain
MIDKPYYWLNSHSRLFLERGYLEPNKTPEQRIKEIAINAEKILDIKDFANKFEHYMSLGYYSLSTPVWTNYGNQRGLPVSCVVGDTWINTKYNGGKLAKDIEIGDEVLTHKGRYKKVIDIILTKNQKDIYKIKVSSRMTPLYITGNHLVLTNLGWVRCDELNPDYHFIAINGDIEYIEKDYEIDLKLFCDFEPNIINGKICKLITDNIKYKKRSKNGVYVDNYSTPKEKIQIDNDLAWAFGLWFAEGSLSIRDGSPCGIRITYNTKDEKELGDRWFHIMSEKFGLKGNIYNSICNRNGKSTSWSNANINSNIIGRLFESFGKGCKEKTIPQWIIDLPKDKLNFFLKGILDGDGTKTKSKSNRITVANPKMLLQIYQIGLKLGLQMSLQMQQKAGKLATTNYVYTCSFISYETDNRRSSKFAIKFNDGLYYSKIKEILKTDKLEDVYDFAVEDDHSFSAAGVLLHNCFNSHISDRMDSILYKVAEVGMMSKLGGGTSGYFGELRGRGSSISVGGESSGPIHFMELFDKVADVISQGSARRGSFAAYLPVEHSDIEEFLQIRNEGHPIQNMSIAVTISDDWMKSMVDGDKNKRKIWAKIIQKRFESGYPYIFFSDTINNNAPQVYKDKKLKINASNLCSEITLSSDENNSFVCVLSSLNLLHWDEIEKTDAIETMIYFLDSVNQEFIEKTENIRFMKSARNFAINQRALGMGVLGWHSYLQSKMISFESMKAKALNNAMWQTIRHRADVATRELSDKLGEAPILEGYGKRNVTTLAVAPTTSSSFILGQVSPSIEPLNSNYFVKNLAKGKFTYKNPYLKEILKKYHKNDDTTWKSILIKGGSVQHLDFLNKEEKEIFKTFGEISQKEIVIQASNRQKFIDQSQSLNIMIGPNTPPKQVSDLLIEGWKMGVKTFYYQRSANPAQELARNILSCTSCEA